MDFHVSKKVGTYRYRYSFLLKYFKNTNAFISPITGNIKKHIYVHETGSVRRPVTQIRKISNGSGTSKQKLVTDPDPDRTIDTDLDP